MVQVARLPGSLSIVLPLYVVANTKVYLPQTPVCPDFAKLALGRYSTDHGFALQFIKVLQDARLYLEWSTWTLWAVYICYFVLGTPLRFPLSFAPRSAMPFLANVVVAAKKHRHHHHS